MSTSVLPLRPACADDAGSWCARIYGWTSNDTLARSADTIVTTVWHIALILVLTFVARWALHRLIHRVIEGAASVPGLVSRAPLGRRGRARRNGDGSEADRHDRDRRDRDGHAAAARSAQRARTVGSVLRSTASVVVLTIGAVMVLAEFGVNLGPILASAGIVGVAVGFGAQNLVRDFLSGMFMLLEDQYGVGDIVDLGEAGGVVEAVGLRITTLRDVNGTVWYVRNGEILRVGNKSQGYAVAVVDIPVGHSADIAEASALIGRIAAERVTAEDLAVQVLGPVEVLGVERVGPEGVTLRVTVKVGPGQQFAVQRALNAAITDAFDEAGVPRPTVVPAAVEPG